jgi:hypothetical protein
MLDIYSKSDQSDLDFDEIRRMIKKYKEAYEGGEPEVQ